MTEPQEPTEHTEGSEPASEQPAQASAPDQAAAPAESRPKGGDPFRGFIRRAPLSSLAIALLLGMIVGIGAGGSVEDEPAAAQPIPSVETTTSPSPTPEDSPEPEPEPPPAPAADPTASFTRQCDYILDFQGNSAGEFVAQAKVENTGNVGIVVQARAQWDQLGYPPIRMTKTVRLDVDRSTTIRFRRNMSNTEVDRHQSADSECAVKVAIVDTFGVPR